MPTIITIIVSFLFIAIAFFISKYLVQLVLSKVGIPHSRTSITNFSLHLTFIFALLFLVFTLLNPHVIINHAINAKEKRHQLLIEKEQLQQLEIEKERQQNKIKRLRRIADEKEKQRIEAERFAKDQLKKEQEKQRKINSEKEEQIRKLQLLSIQRQIKERERVQQLEIEKEKQQNQIEQLRLIADEKEKQRIEAERFAKDQERQIQRKKNNLFIIHNSMSNSDLKTLNNILENEMTNTTATWRSPQTGNHYSVTPLRIYDSGYGQPCREYSITATISGNQIQATDKACRTTNYQ